ncbi:hypothetical protein GCM10009740_31320 [Terrabacter terrae]|uniref:Uncharacterized protein n=1 Tax=Terrabacter terrae TaxID=318434 RepID=A0ABN2UI09_9MICO
MAAVGDVLDVPRNVFVSCGAELSDADANERMVDPHRSGGLPQCQADVRLDAVLGIDHAGNRAQSQQIGELPQRDDRDCGEPDEERRHRPEDGPAVAEQPCDTEPDQQSGDGRA